MITALKLANPNFYTATYGLDGEGRWNSLKHGSQTEVPTSGVTYNAASQPTNIDIGTGTDFDSYAYSGYTGLMTGWTFQAGSALEQQTASLNWNPIGTLASLAITDGFNSGGTQTCNFGESGTMGYDDWNRLLSDSCGTGGSIWNQTYSYDQYDNLTKASSGYVSWNPGYNSANNHYNCTGCTYDSNGNVTNDGTNAYTWNEFSKMKSVNLNGSGCSSAGECMVYDAFGRVVEVDNGSTHTEIWFTQLGKTAYLNGSTKNYAYLPAPGGATFLDDGSTAGKWMHKDWLGSTRLVSSISAGTITSDRAYAPYGEIYDIFGSTNQNEAIFTGDTQDVIAGMYDTPNRELQGGQQGRWLSPDPSGSQWNQYAYPANPLSFVDPSGLQLAFPGGCNLPDGCGAPGFGEGGGGFCDASGNCGAGTGVDGWGNTGLNGVGWNWGPGYIGTVGSGASGLLAQQNGWYASCVSYNFNCDANGNYVPPDGAYVITVSCGGTFAQIDCAAPPQAVAGSQSISILTSLGMQNGLGLLAQYQADPMSSSGKDILQQLSQMSSSAEAFIIEGYGVSVVGSVAGAVGADIAAGASESDAFGTAFYNNKGFLNGGPLRLGGSFDAAEDMLYFSLHSDWFHFDMFEWWP